MVGPLQREGAALLERGGAPVSGLDVGWHTTGARLADLWRCLGALGESAGVTGFRTQIRAGMRDDSPRAFVWLATGGTLSATLVLQSAISQCHASNGALSRDTGSEAMASRCGST